MARRTHEALFGRWPIGARKEQFRLREGMFHISPISNRKYFLVVVLATLCLNTTKGFADSGDAVKSLTSTSTAENGFGKTDASKVAEPGYVGECFSFHGRAQFANGNPSFRIWRIGTKSYVAIPDDRCSALPENLSKLMQKSGDMVYGDFSVCPLSKFKKGNLQFVCVQSVRVTAVEHEKPNPCEMPCK